ncbi:ring-hydroxylating dioxygenase subunit beta [Amycolatopsis acidiphila]|uniref:Ring-hydroxylating dioxygenase subunit beta n=1 Tax=Amycolatopsis acidiphila TaxID=715473 RepID=A0A558AP55_9PSEU|nr:aromatic-ring-hydroxylating dioxygenase subunit beta [Amycolatopsis acidiphila]TVT26029.1 ring-hydroxylating dioxygenase subunit beta [Amycolatopsis acidiphila]UIJ63254.1 ring-hydroxylating dioxygenase subunit beta [Amycolatopsis acidiphila]GHG74633.1 ring-hydroxylating dioxygenase subunit beta [Amycolatopsis acidiphila]
MTSATETGAVGIDPAIASFLFLEARLADEARYSEWEELWDDDGLYWVPMSPDADPAKDLSYIYDNRRRIRSRVAQLNTGARHSQTPPSQMRRLLTNMELLDRDAETVTVGSNFVLFEYRYQLTTWAGRVIHRVRVGAPERGPRLASKTVHLVNAGGPVPTLAFLL